MFSGISIWQLLILLAIVVMVFGTKRLRNLGGDLGAALKDFRGAMNHHDDDKEHEKPAQSGSEESRVIDQEQDANMSSSSSDAQRREGERPSTDSHHS